MQKIVDNGTTILFSDSGMMLTNDFVYCKAVRLGRNNSGLMWYEITAEEAEKRMNEEITDLKADIKEES